MYRAAARASIENEHAATAALGRWAQWSRALSLVALLALGVTCGLLLVDEWVLVIVLTYVSIGLMLGYLLHRSVGVFALGRALRVRARRLAALYEVDPDGIEAVARAFLV